MQRGRSVWEFGMEQLIHKVRPVELAVEAVVRGACLRIVPKPLTDQ